MVTARVLCNLSFHGLQYTCIFFLTEFFPATDKQFFFSKQEPVFFMPLAVYNYNSKHFIRLLRDQG